MTEGERLATAFADRYGIERDLGRCGMATRCTWPSTFAHHLVTMRR